MCKGQESRAQDMGDRGWGPPLPGRRLHRRCLALQHALPCLRTKLLSPAMAACCTEKMPPQQMLMHAFCSELEAAGLAWPVPPPLPPRAGSTLSSARGADCSKRQSSCLYARACLSPGSLATPEAHPDLLFEGRGPLRGERPPTAAITFPSACLINSVTVSAVR